MIGAVSAVPSISAVSTLTALARISQLAAGGSSSLAVPSVIVDLGATASTPITYNSAGLFAALLQARAATPSAPPTTADSAALAELAALLALGNTATGAEVLDTASGQQGLSASSADALNALLARNFGAVDSASGAAGVFTAGGSLLDATGALLNGTDDSNRQSLLALLSASPDDASTSALETLLRANIELTAATAVTAIGTTPATTISDDTAQRAAAAAENAAAAALDGIVTVPATVAPLTVPDTATITATPTAATAITTPQPTPVAATAPAAAATTATTGTVAATDNNVTLTSLVNAAHQALTNIAQNPAYAMVAAALYAHVAVFRAQRSAPAMESVESAQPIAAVSRINAV